MLREYGQPEIIISIHASTQEATVSASMYTTSLPSISIHASTQEATVYGRVAAGVPIISIHASTQEATVHLNLQSNQLTISIHASTQEATAFKMLLTDFLQFQSTPPRRRRRLRVTGGYQELDFNPRLHAGGDQKEAMCRIIYCYFNPRLHAGGDVNVVLNGVDNTDFNPRLHAGGDVMPLGQQYKYLLFQSTPPRRRRLNTVLF